MTGRNIGDLLNAKGITWGWFQGGFHPTETKDGKAVCGAKSVNIVGKQVTDYSPHHEPFEYYQQTANPHHLPPSSVAMIGKDDQANHQYDLADFYDALGPGQSSRRQLRQGEEVSGRPCRVYSDPIDEQTHLVIADQRRGEVALLEGYGDHHCL